MFNFVFPSKIGNARNELRRVCRSRRRFTRARDRGDTNRPHTYAADFQLCPDVGESSREIEKPRLVPFKRPQSTGKVSGTRRRPADKWTSLQRISWFPVGDVRFAGRRYAVVDETHTFVDLLRWEKVTGSSREEKTVKKNLLRIAAIIVRSLIPFYSERVVKSLKYNL